MVSLTAAVGKGFALVNLGVEEVPSNVPGNRTIIAMTRVFSFEANLSRFRTTNRVFTQRAELALVGRRTTLVIGTTSHQFLRTAQLERFPILTRVLLARQTHRNRGTRIRYAFHFNQSANLAFTSTGHFRARINAFTSPAAVLVQTETVLAILAAFVNRAKRRLYFAAIELLAYRHSSTRNLEASTINAPALSSGWVALFGLESAIRAAFW